MSDNVIPLNCITRLDLPIDRVLEEAKDTLTDVVIIGWDKENYLYFASTMADGAEVNWLIDKAKLALLTPKKD